MIQKPIIIWWGVDTSETGFEEGIRAEEPKPILKKFLKEYTGENEETRMLSYCPAIKDELINLYGVKPYYDYRLYITSKNIITTDDYDQNFFNEHVYVRSTKLISLKTNHVFFAPYEKSLLMSQVAPSLEDNSIANSTMLIPGKMDIGKYFRTLDHALILKKETSSIQFLREQVSFYIKFHTTRPIVLRQFFWDKRINEYYRSILAVKFHKYSKASILSYYYNLFGKFQFKKKIIKIIEKNLTTGAGE
jgi:hypothetical protein